MIFETRLQTLNIAPWTVRQIYYNFVVIYKSYCNEVRIQKRWRGKNRARKTTLMMLPKWKAKNGRRPLKAPPKGLEKIINSWIQKIELSKKSWPNERSVGWVADKCRPTYWLSIGRYIGRLSAFSTHDPIWLLHGKNLSDIFRCPTI